MINSFITVSSLARLFLRSFVFFFVRSLVVEVCKLNLVYCGIVRNFICSPPDDSEETAGDQQQEDNPVENDSFEDEPTDDAEESDSGI